MKYITVEAENYDQLHTIVSQQYGDEARILSQRTVRRGGIMGFFGKDVIEAWVSYRDHKPSDASEVQKILRVAGASQSSQSSTAILKEIRNLHHKIDQQRRDFSHQDHTVHTATPALEDIERILEENDFDRAFISRLLRKARTFFSLEQMEDQKFVRHKITEWVIDSIKVENLHKRHKGTVISLIGPTGVGKTTTIAKLAARLGYSSDGKKIADIRILTIDNYRIAAKEQLEKYGEMMQMPVDMVVTAEELRTKLALYNDVDYILVDSIGRSPYESGKLGTMQELLRECGSQSHFALTISATTKQSDIVSIMRQYEPFGYSSIVITKLDETSVIGNVISALYSSDKPISFLTTGQGVPHDIENASVEQLLMRLKLLHIDNAYNKEES